MKKGALLLVALLSLPSLPFLTPSIADESPATVGGAITDEPEPLTHLDAVRELGDLVASGESTTAGGYDAANNGLGMDLGTHGLRRVFGRSHHEITIGEVITAQQERRIHAAGRYQIIGMVLPKAARWAGLSHDQPFNAENQDRMFLALLRHKRPAIWVYLTGFGSAESAADAMAREWSSISYWDGLGYYSGGRAAVSRPQILSALAQARAMVMEVNRAG